MTMNGAVGRVLDVKAFLSGKSFLGTRHARKLPIHSAVRRRHSECVRLPAETFPPRWGYRESRKIFTHQKQKSIRCYHITSLLFATQLWSEKIFLARVGAIATNFVHFVFPFCVNDFAVSLKPSLVPNAIRSRLIDCVKKFVQKKVRKLLCNVEKSGVRTLQPAIKQFSSLDISHLSPKDYFR